MLAVFVWMGDNRPIGYDDEGLKNEKTYCLVAFVALVSDLGGVPRKKLKKQLILTLS